jgi:coniferyl-aldehyde dehydrogenase
MMNAGQICLAPDYLLVAKEQEQEMIDGVVKGVSTLYPKLLNNDDYTSVVNGRNYDRLQGYLADAKRKGCRADRSQPGG